MNTTPHGHATCGFGSVYAWHPRPVTSPLDDPDADWWLKFRHARDHQNRLVEAFDAFKTTTPIELVPGPLTERGVDYRLKVHAPVPPTISLIVGDVLHNLRSALDCLALGLASTDLDRVLTDDEERDCQFPICEDPPSFNKFMRNCKPLRRKRVRMALREVQPYRLLEHFKAMKIESAESRSYQEDSKWDPLTVINRLSNLDKHRRLSVMQWSLGLVYWGSNEGDPSWTWALHHAPPWSDGEIVAHLYGRGSTPPDVRHELRLTLYESPARTPFNLDAPDVIVETRRWVEQVARTINEAIFTYREGRSRHDVWLTTGDVAEP